MNTPLETKNQNKHISLKKKLLSQLPCESSHAHTQHVHANIQINIIEIWKSSSKFTRIHTIIYNCEVPWLHGPSPSCPFCPRATLIVIIYYPAEFQDIQDHTEISCTESAQCVNSRKAKDNLCAPNVSSFQNNINQTWKYTYNISKYFKKLTTAL